MNGCIQIFILIFSLYVHHAVSLWFLSLHLLLTHLLQNLSRILRLPHVRVHQAGLGKPRKKIKYSSGLHPCVTNTHFITVTHMLYSIESGFNWIKCRYLKNESYFKGVICSLGSYS